MLDFISDTEHFTKVLALAAKAKETLWIGTADIKDLYVVQGKMAKPFLGVLSDLIGKGVEVRLIHAKEPRPTFGRISTATHDWPLCWNVSCVRASTSRLLSLTKQCAMLAVPT